MEDIERIRRDFLGENGVWDAIIARSYGTVLAQQYAHFHRDKLNKLILVAPLSRHMFNHSADAFDDLPMMFRKSINRVSRAYSTLRGKNFKRNSESYERIKKRKLSGNFSGRVES